ncbi:hypothetical protein AGABI2DRAFT_178137 [Agaricus bisporus var. bisporus H97]|uniref:hypothetical protein n=1 Tax=Agaricus bisporus var. bisporus (strain H97 / ATCC MYA-4626 / FGSC 10389) TaxID=936046 RepID=UPI00029F7853|nr:hypothetical protein AGABI2DRAFT_178137 [Agaricus bisporus var. bisporus H97]EKV47015.1 hypothetical protein AGABI2DRAFT_178137 [Agaricus bisporus var. bisporus H97]
MKVVADSHNYSSADTLASSLREHAEGTEVAIRLEGDGESSGFEIIWIEVIRRPMMRNAKFEPLRWLDDDYVPTLTLNFRTLSWQESLNRATTSSFKPQTMQLDPKFAILDADSSQLYERHTDFLHQRNLLESPICRLPAELFSRIISQSITPIQYDWIDRPTTIPNTKDLFRLSSVCSHWYNATRSDTQFWGTFALRDIDEESITSTPDYASLLRHYYKHVGTAGLSVWIYDMHIPLRPGDMLHQIFQTIFEENAGKLRSFHVWDFYSAEDAYCISSPIVEYAQREVQFTQLVELEFCWTFEESESPCVLFRNSPLLRKLSLDIPGNSMIPTTLDFPWSRITTVKFCHTYPEYALVLLSSHPHFTEFSFEMFFDNSHTEHTWSAPSQALFEMQLITKFGWCIRLVDEHSRYDPWYIQLLFTHFRFPNLRHLVWNATAPSDHPSTQSFFAAMQQLEHLEFEPLPRSCISQYFDLFDNLKTLDVVLGYDDEFNQQWLKKLIITPGNGNLLPHLRGLRITSGSNDTPCSALIVILYSRCIGPIPRSSLEVDLDCLTIPPYVGSLAELFEKVDWASSCNYGALEILISQANEVYGGLDLPEIKLVFEN